MKSGLEIKREANAQYMREYRITKKAAISEWRRQYRAANRERINQQKRDYWHNNKETINEQRRDNKDANTEITRKWRAVNRDAYNAYMRKWRGANRNIVKDTNREYYQANRGRLLQQKREDYTTNIEVIRERKKLWRNENKEALRRQGRERYMANPKYFMAYGARRRGVLREQCPSWVDQKAIIEFFENRPVGCEVDHIIPLGGRQPAKTPEGYAVRGLHVPWNLQYLPKAANGSKYNRMTQADMELCICDNANVHAPIKEHTALLSQ